MRYIYFICLFMLIIYFLHLKISFRSLDTEEHFYNHGFNDLTYYKFDKSLRSASLDDVNGFQTILNEYNFKWSKYLHKSDIVFFYLLTDYVKLYNKIVNIPTIRYVASLRCIDLFCSKYKLYDILESNLSEELLIKYLPKTYLLGPKHDLSEIVDGELYILKKNIQRQNGLCITKNAAKIQKAYQQNYVVCQKMLQDVFTINKRKINLRVYLLVTITSENPSFYVYNNGFIYYTKKDFVKNSTDPDVHITTGYIDRQIYENNPMTLKDLKQFIKEERYSILNQNILDCLQTLMSAYVSILKKYDTSAQTKFVMFGCDFAVASDLSCKLIEINKGPDLNYKDKRDKEVKYNLVKDTFIMLGIIPGTTNTFTQL